MILIEKWLKLKHAKALANVNNTTVCYYSETKDYMTCESEPNSCMGRASQHSHDCGYTFLPGSFLDQNVTYF